MERPCKFKDCKRKYTGTKGSANGYCSGHYQQARRGEPMRPLLTPEEVGQAARAANRPWTSDEIELASKMRNEGKPFAAIAHAISRSVASVKNQIGTPADEDADSPRCVCGLRLPCNNCLPTAATMGARRPGEFTV